MQQKIVEAAIKLSNEGDLAKTVKKKRRNNCLDAMRKLEEIEKEINAYRIKTGKKPTQRASLIIAGSGSENSKGLVFHGCVSFLKNRLRFHSLSFQ